MAAKPPKPPGNFLNNISTANSSEKNNNKLPNHNNDKSNDFKNTDNRSNNNDLIRSNTRSNESNSDGDALDTSIKPTCNCSNISIMHLFHEMKQEFPTIPDHIVTQCVNENCHDRESCTSVLRNELALNPIPVQAYPSKVLQRQQQQQKLQLQQQLQQLHQQHQQQQQQLHHQQQQHHQQQKPITPLKPTRVAPPPVSVSNRAPIVSNTNCNISAHLGNSENCESASVNNSLQSSKILDKKDVEKVSESLSEVCMVDKTAKTKSNASDMPTSTAVTTPTPVELNNFLQADNAHQISEQQNQQFQQQPQRIRPTTLNLNPSQPQQQLRQQLNVQLQQHLQQRNQPTKPVRKAPLPPLPPKPPLISNNCTPPPPPPSRTPQYSSNTSLSSPISSGGESEISVNVASLSSPTTTTSAAHQQHQHNQLKSPVRHRSVINVQPEPPYTRDFLVSPSSSSGGGSSQKSFTSVNLTLRQPNASAAQSTIDISAGPGLSSAGGTGLTYSSTSYDARRGCQKKFHITVTDEGGVFSASRIKPRSCYNPAGEQERDGSGSAGGVGLRSPAAEQTSPYFNQQQQRIVANFNNSGEMCLPRVTDGFNEILQRQRARRDKLSTALRDNKKRLSQVEQEINILTDPICPGESERLDSEIQRLRCDCEAMLNEIENSKRGDPNIENSQGTNSINSRQQQSPQQAHPPQPFPRQRPPRPPPPGSLSRQPMDFVQHHVVSSTPPMNSPLNQQLPPLPPTYQQLHQQYQQQLLQQQQILQQQQQQQPLQPSTDDEDYSDSNTDGGDEEDEGGLETWACNMCTFRNHPQLNICECCENVRILPGTLRIIPSAAVNGSPSTATPLMLTQLSATTASAPATHATASQMLTRAAPAIPNSPTTLASVASNSLESDTNLTQFALHT